MKTLFQLLIVLMIGCSYAQSNLPACQGNDVVKWNNCIATTTFVSGLKFVGEYRNGKSNGQGAMTYVNGDKYVGEFKDGNSNGQGTYTFANGDVYVGQFKDGAPSGQGNMTNTNGTKYLGEYENGVKHGQGTATFPNGNKYVGEFRNGKYNGQGVFYFQANGEKYSGEWKDGRRTGQGTYIYANGDKYVGQFYDDNNNGQGTYTFANGNMHVGEFKNGRRNGQGILYASDGSTISQGIWMNEKLISSSTSIQQAIAPNIELAKLRLEANEAKRKQAEAEEQLKLSKQQQPSAAPSAPMTTMANRRALVIGNDSYTSVTKLNNAREDAKSIASNLTLVGYQVTLKLDLNEKEMKAALRVFSSQVQGGDEVLFFFAGHGVQLGAANYLLPVDIGGESEAQVKDESIQLQRILDDMSDKKAKFTLAMIDACRDNPFKTAGRAIGGRGMAPTTAATGQMVVFSAGTGQQALDRLGNNDRDKNGVFTRTLLKEMQKSGISIDRIVKNVRNEVAELAKSVGHEQVPAIYDQVLGEFYFKK